MFGDGEASDVAETLTPEGNEKQEVEMKWNLAQFLPEAASCQEIFKVVIASHIQVLHSHMVEEWRGHSPGTTPIRRRDGPSQSQVRVNDGWRCRWPDVCDLGMVAAVVGQFHARQSRTLCSEQDRV